MITKKKISIERAYVEKRRATKHVRTKNQLNTNEGHNRGKKGQKAIRHTESK